MKIDWRTMPMVYEAYRKLLYQEVPPMQAMGEAIEGYLAIVEESRDEVGPDTRD